MRFGWLRWRKNQGAVFLVLSVSLHAALFCLSKEGHLATQNLSRIYEVERVVAPQGSHRKRGDSFSNRKSQSALTLSGSGGVRMGAFRVDPNATLDLGGNPKAVELGTPEGMSDGRGGRWAVPLESLKYTGILSHFHEYIDEALTFPREFIENDIQGRVQATLYFDEKGNYQKEKSRISGNSNYLTVWTKKFFRRIFSHTLPFPIGKTPLKVAMLLEWEIGMPLLLGSSSQSSTRKQMVSGGKLYFYRKGQKSYGIGIAGIGGDGVTSAIGPVVDAFGLLDRVARVTGLSHEEKKEKFRLHLLQNDPEWMKN